MAKNKKNIKLSELLKKYNIQNDMSEEYIDKQFENESENSEKESLGGLINQYAGGGGMGNTSAYVNMGSSISNTGANVNNINNSDMTEEQKKYAKELAMRKGVDSTLSSVPVYGQFYAIGKGLSDNVRSGLGTTNPNTGEKTFNSGSEAAADAWLKPQHEYITDNIAKKEYGKAALSILPGVPQMMAIKKSGYLAEGGDITSTENSIKGIPNNDLTEYNGGGTHEQNPNGGIDIGPNAQVEDKETRWQDYIFSERVKAPGGKYSFAELSKKIEKKYNKRKNDIYDNKALDREMAGLMVLQEKAKAEMKQKQQNELQKAFGGGLTKDDRGSDSHPYPSVKEKDFAGNNRTYPIPTLEDAQDALRLANLHGRHDVISNIYSKYPSLKKGDGGPVTTPDNTNPSDTTTAPINTTATPIDTTATNNTANIIEHKLTHNELDKIYSNVKEKPTTVSLSGQGKIVTRTKVDKEDAGEYKEGSSDVDLKKYGLTDEMKGARVLYSYPTKGKTFENGKDISSEIQGQPVVSKHFNDVSNKYRRNAHIVQTMINDAWQKNKPQDFDENGVPKKNKYLTLKEVEGYIGKDNLWEYHKAIKAIDYLQHKLNGKGFDLAGNIEGKNTDTTNQLYGIKHFSYTWIHPEGVVFSQFQIRNKSQLIKNKSQSQIKNKHAFGGEMENTHEDMMENGEEDKLQFDKGGYNVDMSNYTSNFDSNNTSSGSEDKLQFGKGGLKDSDQSGNDQNGNDQNGINWKQLGIFAAQNIGNLYNIGQGLKGPNHTDLGHYSPQQVDYSKSLDIIDKQYSRAAQQARENIRRHATSSGQALSNLIAQNTALTQNKSDALTKIKEQEMNSNVGINNNAQLQNLNILRQQEELNQRNLAASQNAMETGLQGLGKSVATDNKDQNMSKVQQQTIEDWLKTNKYSVQPDGNGGYQMVDQDGNPV